MLPIHGRPLPNHLHTDYHLHDHVTVTRGGGHAAATLLLPNSQKNDCTLMEWICLLHKHIILEPLVNVFSYTILDMNLHISLQKS